MFSVVSRMLPVSCNNAEFTPYRNTNTFSFDDPITFKEFLAKRTIHQARMMRNLRFEMDLANYDFHKKVGHIAWESAMNTTTVKSLAGLRNLRLQIFLNTSFVPHSQKLKDSSTQCRGPLKSLGRLSTLPLTSVQVAVRQAPKASLNGQWSKNEWDAISDGLRKTLLIPKTWRSTRS